MEGAGGRGEGVYSRLPLTFEENRAALALARQGVMMFRAPAVSLPLLVRLAPFAATVVAVPALRFAFQLNKPAS